jgi:PleD family two-component response regulator
VLRLVAARLARVGGRGQAFRVGGEEFSILFPGGSIKETLPHLEMLRAEVERSMFRVRSAAERRQHTTKGGDRRRPGGRKALRRRGAGAASLPGEISVTISIGVAEPGPATQPVEQVIQAADKALYRAKQGGRNRVETAAVVRAPRLRREIA